MKRVDAAIEGLGNLWEGTRNVGRNVGHAFWWSGYVATRAVTVTVAAVPGAALLAKGADAISMAIKGVEISGGTLDNLQNTANTMTEDSSALTRLGGVALETYTTSAAVADDVANWGGDVVGVATQGSEGWDRAGEALVDGGVAAGAGYVAYKAARAMPQIPRPPHRPVIAPATAVPQVAAPVAQS